MEDFLSYSPGDVRSKMSHEFAFHEQLIESLLRRLIDILHLCPNVLRLDSPIIVCGDIHGQMYDLFQLFSLSPEIPDTQYLFLGDYVDRGYQSTFTFVYLAYLKVKYPSRVHLLRGNHETRSINLSYGFHNELLATYGHSGLWDLFNRAFDLLPICAVVDRRWFCVHGGISPHCTVLQRIHLIDRASPDQPDNSAFQHLLWSDPSDDVVEFQANMRGAGVIFGAPQAQKFLRVNNLRRIARAHQLANEGFKWFFERKLVLVWSAPNYGYQRKNSASVMRVDGENEPEFVLFEADPKSDERPIEDLGVMDYFA
jgi:diadenosine tetraphosphatase ApaH/serine/threonine PP2A family protein phosphatase